MEKVMRNVFIALVLFSIAFLCGVGYTIKNQPDITMSEYVDDKIIHIDIGEEDIISSPKVIVYGDKEYVPVDDANKDEGGFLSSILPWGKD